MALTIGWLDYLGPGAEYLTEQFGDARKRQRKIISTRVSDSIIELKTLTAERRAQSEEIAERISEAQNIFGIVDLDKAALLASLPDEAYAKFKVAYETQMKLKQYDPSAVFTEGDANAFRNQLVSMGIDPPLAAATAARPSVVTPITAAGIEDVTNRIMGELDDVPLDAPEAATIKWTVNEGLRFAFGVQTEEELARRTERRIEAATGITADQQRILREGVPSTYEAPEGLRLATLPEDPTAVLELAAATSDAERAKDAEFLARQERARYQKPLLEEDGETLTALGASFLELYPEDLTPGLLKELGTAGALYQFIADTEATARDPLTSRLPSRKLGAALFSALDTLTQVLLVDPIETDMEAQKRFLGIPGSQVAWTNPNSPEAQYANTILNHTGKLLDSSYEESEDTQIREGIGALSTAFVYHAASLAGVLHSRDKIRDAGILFTLGEGDIEPVLEVPTLNDAEKDNLKLWHEAIKQNQYASIDSGTTVFEAVAQLSEQYQNNSFEISKQVLGAENMFANATPWNVLPDAWKAEEVVLTSEEMAKREAAATAAAATAAAETAAAEEAERMTSSYQQVGAIPLTTTQLSRLPSEIETQLLALGNAVSDANSNVNAAKKQIERSRTHVESARNRLRTVHLLGTTEETLARNTRRFSDALRKALEALATAEEGLPIAEEALLARQRERGAFLYEIRGNENVSLPIKWPPVE